MPDRTNIQLHETLLNTTGIMGTHVRAKLKVQKATNSIGGPINMMINQTCIPRPSAGTRTALILVSDFERREEFKRSAQRQGYQTVCPNDFSSAMFEMAFHEGIEIVFAEYHLEETDYNGINGAQFIECCRLKFPSRQVRYILIGVEESPSKLAASMNDNRSLETMAPRRPRRPARYTTPAIRAI